MTFQHFNIDMEIATHNTFIKDEKLYSFKIHIHDKMRKNPFLKRDQVKRFKGEGLVSFWFTIRLLTVSHLPSH